MAKKRIGTEAATDQKNGNGSAEALGPAESAAAKLALVLPADTPWFTELWATFKADADKLENGQLSDAQARNTINLRRNQLRAVELHIAQQRLYKGMKAIS